MWFDSHCHLQLCEQADASSLVESARSAGVERLVTIGVDEVSNAAARDIAQAHGIWFSAGVHPNEAEGWDAARTSVERLLDDPRCVAVGETGLDFYRMGAARDVQDAAFRDHIDLAKTRDKALVIHTRDSVKAAIELLEEVGPPPRLVFHCWSGETHDLARALALGAYVSFAGNVSFASAQSLRDAAKEVPAERLLVETDSPYLTPVPYRGKPNEPANVAHVGAALAEARGEAIASVASSTSDNARALFRV